MSTQSQSSVKGVADIVFLLDTTLSMQPCIDALKENIKQFIDFLTSSNLQVCPVRDWRAKVVGFRDFEDNDADPFVDNPFVRDANDLKVQLDRLHAAGGGDIPESLLDAIYKIVTMPQMEKGSQSEDPSAWRYRSSAARVVIVFTDAPYKETMTIPEARGGSLDDIVNIVYTNRIILNIFAPDMPCYDKLSGIDKSEYEPIPFDTSDPYGPQKALQEFTADRENFKNTLKALAASVSKSAATPQL